MSRLSCSFCRHRNPEASKFCNECGAALHLVACGHCEAINHVEDKQCYRCGELLPAAPVDALPTDAAASAESTIATPSIAYDSAIAAQDADRAEHCIVHAADDAEHAAEDTAVQGSNMSHADNRPAPPYRQPVVVPVRSGRRAQAMLLAGLFFAVGGAVYWFSINPAERPERGMPAEPAPATAQAPQPSRAPGPTEDTAGMVPQPTTSGALPPTDMPAPPAALPPSASTEPSNGADVNPASRSTAARSTTTKPDPRATAETPRRANSHVRTKEEAERDALATQRLINRALGN